MKKFNELTIEEIANLTEEQIEQYEKLLCAENGIKILDKPEEPTSDVDETKNLEIFKVNGFGGYLYFTDMDEAKTVMNCLKSLNTIGTTKYFADRKYFEVGPEKDYNNKPVDISISSEMVYTKDKAVEIETALKGYKEAKKQYDTDLKEYNEAYEAKEAAIKEFKDLYEEACHIMHYRQTLTRIFYKDYLPIAEGNEQIAIDFLRKAYTVNEDDEAYVKSHKPEENK